MKNRITHCPAPPALGGHRRGHGDLLPLFLGHRCGHRDLGVALVAAEDVAGQSAEALIAGGFLVGVDGGLGGDPSAAATDLDIAEPAFDRVLRLLGSGTDSDDAAPASATWIATLLTGPATRPTVSVIFVQHATKSTGATRRIAGVEIQP